MYLKKITLENLRGFPRLAFDFQRPGGVYAGWTVLVGGNASGKSTLLRAMALALVGPDVGRQLTVPSGWVGPNGSKSEVIVEVDWDQSIDSFKKGGSHPGKTFEAGVRWIEDRARTSELTANSTPEFGAVVARNAKGTRIITALRGPWEEKARGWFAAGYGPMRRLSGSSSESIRLSVVGGALSRFVTLFREDAALSESEAWLKLNHSRSLEAKDNIELASLLDGVQDLLGDGLLPYGMRISRLTVDHVFVRDGRGIELPMRDISDGCRSIYATVLDLVHNMAETYGTSGLFAQEGGRTVVTKPGVVLIDEIEAHLHPRWQREIPEWLKLHFPRMQFIVSTHSPLIAQAADPHGVFVLPSQDDPDRQPRMLDEHEYELLKLRRAEKTLLGSAFGLQSTRSKWANDQIARWKRLNSKSQSGAPLTSAEAKDLATLEDQMKIVFEPTAAVEGGAAVQ